MASAALLGLATFGCGGPPKPPAPKPKTTNAGRQTAKADNLFGTSSGMDPSMREALLRNIINLLENAPLTPGGQNIDIATANLNQYFKATPSESYRLSTASRPYLEVQLADSPFEVDDFESPSFALKDARHIEDCLLYHNIAARVAGPGTTLERVGRLFDWSVRHVQLIPFDAPIPDGLIQQGLQPAPARPYDVIIRGLGSEIPGQTWAERSWVFMALCRQIGVDAAMLSYEVDGSEEPYYWTCAALVDGAVYLFDTRIGMEVPGPDGTGVATLQEAATDPIVLDRLDLPAPPIPYETSADDLGKVRVWIDSSRGYFAPKMRLLQNDLAGANRMVLHRDPAEQRDAWTAALGDRLDSVDLWDLPLAVEYRLFTDPSYVQTVQFVNFFFSPDFPLLGARLKQLRGDLADAKHDYTRFRFREVLEIGGEVGQLPPPIREALDLYATYFLALSQLEDGRPDQAVNLFEQALTLPPGDELKGQLHTLVRLGAKANLGLLYEARGNADRATFYDSRSNTTSQSQGNLLRANALVFEDPFGPPPPSPSTDAEAEDPDPPAVDAPPTSEADDAA